MIIADIADTFAKKCGAGNGTSGHTVRCTLANRIFIAQSSPCITIVKKASLVHYICSDCILSALFDWSTTVIYIMIKK